MADHDSTAYCYYCATAQPISNFHKSKLQRRKSGDLKGSCKLCTQRYNARYREANGWKLRMYEDRRRNPERHAKYRMRRRAKRMGMTEAQYREMHDAQGGKCAICSSGIVLERMGCGQGTHGDIACIDHCHATNAVRGLLCQQCNIGIGAFKDHPELLRAAIAYLEKVRKAQ